MVARVMAHVTYSESRIAILSVWNSDRIGAATTFGVPVADSASGVVSSSCNVASVLTAKRGVSPVAVVNHSALTAITVPTGTVLDDTIREMPNLDAANAN